jgi:hypothetical protein
MARGDEDGTQRPDHLHSLVMTGVATNTIELMSGRACE